MRLLIHNKYLHRLGHKFDLIARLSPSTVVEAPDPELLLVDWLNALIYEMATRRMLFSRFRVTIAGNRLIGTAWGEVVDVARHHPAVEVKSATYTELSVTAGKTAPGLPAARWTSERGSKTKNRFRFVCCIPADACCGKWTLTL